MHHVGRDCGSRDRRLLVTIWAKRDTVEHAGTRRRSWPVLGPRRVIGAVAVCTGQGTHRPNAREGWLDLPDPARSDPLRTSRTGLATDSAASRQWRRAELPPLGVHPRPRAA